MLLRAGVVAALGFGLGVLGHVSADGLLPGPGALAGGFLACWVASSHLLRRPASTPRLVAMLVGGQFAVHLFLSTLAGHRGDAPAAAAPATVVPPTPLALPEVNGQRVGSLYAAYAASAPRVPGDGGTGLAVPHVVQDLVAHAPMMLVHVLAAVLVGLWLACGERALWSLLGLAGRRLVGAFRARPATPVLVRPARSLVLPRTVPRPTGSLLAQPCSRRGPPLVLA